MAWRALISAVRRTARPAPIAAGLQYLLDDLDEDTFVITRGC